MAADTLDRTSAWERGLNQPVETNVVEEAPCQEVVMTGAEVQGPGNGWMPANTDLYAGYDVGPYFTAATWITKDIDSSVQNMGVYRGNLKAADRLAVMMQISTQSGGYNHWKGYQKRKEKMPVCIILGCPPVVEYGGRRRSNWASMN